jgi:Ni/Co efflux regulator RcnB
MKKTLLASVAVLALMAMTPALAEHHNKDATDQTGAATDTGGHDAGGTGGHAGGAMSGGGHTDKNNNGGAASGGGHHDQDIITGGAMTGSGGHHDKNNTGGAASGGGHHDQATDTGGAMTAGHDHAGRGHNSAFDATVGGGMTGSGGSTGGHHDKNNNGGAASGGGHHDNSTIIFGIGGHGDRATHGNGHRNNDTSIIFGIGGHGYRNSSNFGHSRHNDAYDQFRRARHATHRYRDGSYHRPSGWYYRTWNYGDFLPALFFGDRYQIDDYYDFDLPDPPDGTVWVRYGNDALLVDGDTGEIIQVVYGIFY